MTAREVDIHTLPSMLTALRLPSFHKLWAEIATRADTEGWPAARFLAVLAEYELAERDVRRIRRHLNEAQLPAGKTLATFDFKALPTLPRARVEALAAGDWLDGGGNLIAIGNSGTGKTHILCAIGHAPGRGRAPRLLHPDQRSGPKAPSGPPRSRPRGRTGKTRQVRPDHPRRHHLRPQGSGRNRRPLRTHRPTLRIPQYCHRGQSAVQRMGSDLPGQGHDRRGHRPPCPPRKHPRDERRKLPPACCCFQPRALAEAPATTNTDNQKQGET